MDYKVLLAAKVKTLDDVRGQIAELDNKKTQLLQAGLELQGAVKQLHELMQAETKSESEVPAA